MSTDSLKFEGFIELEIRNTKDNTVIRQKNTITQAGKMLLLDKSAARLLLSGGDSFGYMVQIGRLDKMLGVGSQSNYKAGREARDDSMLTCALLNFGAAAANWNETTTSINPFNASLETNDKVVGFANNNIQPPASSKEGSLDYCLGQFQIDGKTVAERYKFPEGVASGTINVVAMMPADSIKKPNGQGWQVAKCLDRCHIQSPNFVSLSTGFLPPNIEGYTKSDEILLNFNTDGISQWKYNLLTGDLTEVPAGDPFFVVDNSDRSVFDILVDNGYLYVLRASSTAMPLTTSNLAQVTVYQISNNMQQVAQFNITRKVSGENKTAFKFFKIGDDLYISGWVSSALTTAAGSAKYWKINKNASGYGTSATSGTDYSAIGELGLPAGINMDHAGLASTQNGNIWLYVSCDPEYADSAAKVKDNGYINMAYQCYQTPSDILSSGGITFSGVEVFGLTPNAYFNGNQIIRIGANFCSQLSGDNLGQVADNLDYSGDIVNSQGTKVVDYTTAGCFLSKPVWSGNLFSFVYLTTPIEKTENDILYVTYGYRII